MYFELEWKVDGFNGSIHLWELGHKKPYTDLEITCHRFGASVCNSPVLSNPRV